MAITRTDIANLAAGHLGNSVPIQEMNDDRSAIALACRTYFDRTVKLVLRDFNWPFATKIQTLQTVTNPSSKWDLAYGWPSDCLKFRLIESDFRVDNRNSKVPFRIVRGSSGKIILTDRPDAVGEYTMNVTDVNMFDEDFAMALSWRLAFYIAPAITGGDPFKLKQDAWSGYNIELAQAKENAAGEEVDREEPKSEFEYARGD